MSVAAVTLSLTASKYALTKVVKRLACYYGITPLATASVARPMVRSSMSEPVRQF